MKRMPEQKWGEAMRKICDVNINRGSRQPEKGQSRKESQVYRADWL